MKNGTKSLREVLDWLDALLTPEAFDDVSNNGLQIARRGTSVRRVAFAVDASLASVRAAAQAKADLLVVHHGISWGGGIRRLDGGVYEVVKAAIEADLALYASHLPLDANEDVGNNWELARALKLKDVRRAFRWRGATIGVIGTDPDGLSVGICSGGGGAFAEEAKRLGCDLFLTGEADWGETVAAENVGMPMLCAGHYETETYGVKALARRLGRELKVETVFLPRQDGEVAT